MCSRVEVQSRRGKGIGRWVTKRSVLCTSLAKDIFADRKNKQTTSTTCEGRMLETCQCQSTSEASADNVILLSRLTNRSNAPRDGRYGA